MRELGAVPAYATTAGGAPEDVEPDRKRRRTRRGSLIAPEEPGEQLSRDEFQELVPTSTSRRAGEPARAAARRSSRRAGVAQKAPPPSPSAPSRQPPSATRRRT